ncbi:hypothetical protein M9H77_27755 [Catharanthus roseus]|uniref:Uncharacterized protein n=1 Tax=Catharanthus roseus TaxID=4058 RepID=A0ACC0ADD9_CATRO|nr:hypothetical protein M9H77_27755 [Catharanthus roseus]
MSRGLALCMASPPYKGIFRTTCLSIVPLEVRPKAVLRLTLYHALRRGSPVRVAQGGLVGTLRARYLLMYMSCEVEKSNIRTVYFGFQAGIDYGMPKFVPMTPFKDPDSVR